jgi:2-phosphosulfolactate phosphatase
MDAGCSARPAATDLGLVAAIDVIRAFTTAAILLTRGAREIICVRTFSDVRKVAKGIEPVLVAGEQRDPPFPHVDLPNSPVVAASADVAGRVIVFCTVNGTKVLADIPPEVTAIACSAVNVAASAAWILADGHSGQAEVTCTDPDAGEDIACADHLAALLRREVPDTAATRRAIIAAASVHERQWRAKVPEDMWRSFVADVDVCAQVDAYPVVLECRRDDRGLIVMRKGSAQ